MTAQERRTKLKEHPTLRMLWMIILVLQALPIVGVVLLAFGLSTFLGITGAWLSFVWVIAGLLLAYTALIFSTVWSIQSWIVVLMWIGFILNVLSILSDQSTWNLVSVAVSAFTLFSYRAILKFVGPAKA